jgi:hypothetical protein
VPAAAGIAARRALPIGVLAAAVPTVASLVALAAWRPSSLWPLHGAGLALVLGVSAWCSDERLAPLVDATPRCRPFAVRIRLLGPAALAVVWVGMHLLRRSALPPHLLVLCGQGLAAALVGVAIGSRARASGSAEGGARAALVVVPVLVGWALARPWSDHLPVFPVWPWEAWGRAAVLWGAAAVVAASTLAAEGRWLDRPSVRRAPRT